MMRGDFATTAGHSAACRERVEKEMANHEDLAKELERSEQRTCEAMARQMERLCEKRKNEADDAREEGRKAPRHDCEARRGEEEAPPPDCEAERRDSMGEPTENP